MNIATDGSYAVTSEMAGEALLISAEQLAAMMNVSTRTLWRLLSAGKLPEPVRLGGLTRWRLDRVRQWIDEGCPTRSGAK